MQAQPLRVAVWSTGGIGRIAIRALQIVLIGVLVTLGTRRPTREVTGD